jgi:hypothetical protein
VAHGAEILARLGLLETLAATGLLPYCPKSSTSIDSVDLHVCSRCICSPHSCGGSQAISKWVIEYLIVESRVLKAQLRGHGVRLSDAERRRLALLGARLGRRILTDLATIVGPDSGAGIANSPRHRRYPKRRPGRSHGRRGDPTSGDAHGRNGS